jgi:hypothetical protein
MHGKTCSRSALIFSAFTARMKLSSSTATTWRPCVCQLCKTEWNRRHLNLRTKLPVFLHLTLGLAILTLPYWDINSRKAAAAAPWHCFCHHLLLAYSELSSRVEANSLLEWTRLILCAPLAAKPSTPAAQSNVRSPAAAHPAPIPAKHMCQITGKSTVTLPQRLSKLSALVDIGTLAHSR